MTFRLDHIAEPSHFSKALIFFIGIITGMVLLAAIEAALLIAYPPLDPPIDPPAPYNIHLDGPEP